MIVARKQHIEEDTKTDESNGNSEQNDEFPLRIHKESWILDVFQRITCDEGVCHVPCDLEISNQELSHIVRKAEQWRGINGERRKMAVYDYIWKKETIKAFSTLDSQHLEHYSVKDEEDSSKDITTHIMIYTIHLRGYRDLYRQFLRLPDGAIVEIFGDFSGINLIPSEVNDAVEDHANQIYSPVCDAGAVDIKEQKKSTGD
ncbi:uncharacterized protein LOC142201153 [Leptodactylus fuscus]|uniref:uncharacterized protein LOC142201153 n=1 Tax=Leptodactylus fuscus TaxID=238119 RepID=UPI003F4E791E